MSKGKIICLYSTSGLSLLKEYLKYDPVKGVFTWIKSPTRSRVQIGDEAGSITKLRHTSYRYIEFCGKKYAAHRLAWFYMTGTWPDKVIDHKDGDGLNLAWDNLREADFVQSSCNRCKPKTNKSGVKGVHWDGFHGKWRGVVYFAGKRYHVGFFDDIASAEENVRFKRQTLHKEFTKHE